jgi:hypothetical protein
MMRSDRVSLHSARHDTMTGKQTNTAALFVAVGLVMMVVMWVDPVVAALMPVRSLPELAQESTIICTCQAVSQESRWDPDQNAVVTDVKLQVEEYLKGAAGSDIAVQTLRGVAAPGLTPADAPVFEQGERAILFLQPIVPRSVDGERYQVVGGVQGKFTIRTNPKTGEERIERHLEGIHSREKAGEAGGDMPRTLNELRSAILATVSPPAATVPPAAP